MPVVLPLLLSLLPVANTTLVEPLPVVHDLDIESFYGKYLEIGTYAQWWEAGCSNTAMTFAKMENSTQLRARLTIECDRGFFHPKMRGQSMPIDDAVPARMMLTFKPPVGKTMREEFDVIMAADDYSWIVVGHPSRTLLWVLARRPEIPTYTLAGILEQLRQFYGYADVYTKFSCTKHSGADLA
ncbi:MAG: hypothetical protein EOO40_07550, partial [Deltaproteobacteria bacterium]